MEHTLHTMSCTFIVSVCTRVLRALRKITTKKCITLFNLTLFPKLMFEWLLVTMCRTRLLQISLWKMLSWSHNSVLLQLWPILLTFLPLRPLSSTCWACMLALSTLPWSCLPPSLTAGADWVWWCSLVWNEEILAYSEVFLCKGAWRSKSICLLYFKSDFPLAAPIYTSLKRTTWYNC